MGNDQEVGAKENYPNNQYLAKEFPGEAKAKRLGSGAAENDDRIGIARFCPVHLSHDLHPLLQGHLNFQDKVWSVYSSRSVRSTPHVGNELRIGNFNY